MDADKNIGTQKATLEKRLTSGTSEMLEEKLPEPLCISSLSQLVMLGRTKWSRHQTTATVGTSTRKVLTSKEKTLKFDPAS